jgi:hypothetical protein
MSLDNRTKQKPIILEYIYSTLLCKTDHFSMLGKLCTESKRSTFRKWVIKFTLYRIGSWDLDFLWLYLLPYGSSVCHSHYSPSPIVKYLQARLEPTRVKPLWDLTLKVGSFPSFKVQVALVSFVYISLQ